VSSAASVPPADLRHLLESLPPTQAGEALATLPPGDVARALQEVSPAVALEALEALPGEARRAVEESCPAERAAQWRVNATFPADTVGRLMDPALALFAPETTVGEATERLRELVRRAFITYGWVVDPQGRLVGILVFRELLFAEDSQPLSSVMLRSPFALRPGISIPDAMKEVAARHFPVYPVCDDGGRLLGVLRGSPLVATQAFEISAQAGKLVGVDREERLATPWVSSLKSRHPWLQLNLLTAFVAAAVVGYFQDTIDRLVILAAFLPVLAGQSGNTGCQALAVCLRAMTLGDLLSSADSRRVVLKEALLGLSNGLLVGVSASLGMLLYARSQGSPDTLLLAVVVFLAMTASCVVSGVAGAIIPQVLRRLGADPATASSIFLTTATDVVSMGVFLGLATRLIPS
jgi:magnesium transporter